MPLRYLLLALVGVLFLLAAAGVWLAGSSLIAVAPRAVDLAGLALPGQDAQTLSLPLPGGHVVAGSFLPGRGSGAVLLLHGIHGDRRDMAGRARFLHAQGYAVMLIDLPGQGASTLDAVTFGLREALGVRVALEAL